MQAIKFLLLTILFVFIAIAVLANTTRKAKMPSLSKEEVQQNTTQVIAKKAEREKICKEVDAAVAGMRKAGLFVKGSSSASEILVSRHWYGVPYKDKINFLKSASYCYSTDGRVTVKDGYSGKIIARVDSNGPQVLE